MIIVYIGCEINLELRVSGEGNHVRSIIYIACIFPVSLCWSPLFLKFEVFDYVFNAWQVCNLYGRLCSCLNYLVRMCLTSGLIFAFNLKFHLFLFLFSVLFCWSSSKVYRNRKRERIFLNCEEESFYKTESRCTTKSFSSIHWWWKCLYSVRVFPFQCFVLLVWFCLFDSVAVLQSLQFSRRYSFSIFVFEKKKN